MPRIRGIIGNRQGGGGSPPPPPPPPPPMVPEITVLGNSTSIADGDTTPSLTDLTNHGTVTIGGSSTPVTYTIQNPGTGVLTIGSVSVPVGFSLNSTPASSIPASGSTTFQVQLDSSVVGTKSGDVSFSTNVTGKNPYNFALIGVVENTIPTAPNITVTGNGVEIADGDSTPSVTDHTSFGTVTEGGSTITRTFTVTNTGSANLTTSGMTVPSGYTITEGLSATITPGNSDTFQVRLDASTVGVKSGDISFTTNVTGKNPFNFAISGEVEEATPSAFATTMAFKNESGSATESTWVTQPFGMPFKQGDIPSGQYPRVRISGTPVDYSWWGKTTHPDGSWRFCGMMLRIPSSLANGATMTLDIDATASAPSSASVGLANLYAAQIDVQAVGGITGGNLTGTWNATLSQAEAEAALDITDLTDTSSGNGGGSVCKYYRIGIPFKSGGSPHAGLYTYFWAFVMQDGAGGLYDISVLPGVTKPWMNKSGDTDWNQVTFADLVLRRANGTVEVQRPVLPHAPSFQFTRNGNSITKVGTPAEADGQRQLLTYTVSSTGTLPSGITTNTAYKSYWLTDPTSSRLSRLSHWDEGSFEPVTMTDNGTGTHTATVRPWVNKFEICWIAPSSANYNFLGIGTRSSAATLSTSPRVNMSYFTATKVVMPTLLDQTSTLGDQAKIGYSHGNLWPFLRHSHETSPGQWPGNTHHIAVEYMARPQTLGRWQNVCGMALAGQGRRTLWLDYNVKNFGTVNATSDPGVGLSWKDSRLNFSIYIPPAGWTGPNQADAPRVLGQTTVNVDMSHASAVHATPYAITGRNEALVLLLGQFFGNVANKFWLYPDQASFTFDGQSYVGNHWHCDYQGRDAAWTMRDLSAMIWLTPDIHPHRTELNRLRDMHREYLVRCHNNRASGTSGKGMLPFNSITSDTHVRYKGGFGHGFSYHYLVNEVLRFIWMFNDGTLTPILEELRNYPIRWASQGNVAQLEAYSSAGQAAWVYDWDETKPAYDDTPPYIRYVIDSIPGERIYTVGYSFGYSYINSPPNPGNYPHQEWTWDAATDTITWHDFHWSMARELTNGDMILFQHVNPFYGWYGPTPMPDGCVKGTKYYIGNVSSTATTRTFKLYRDVALTDLVDITGNSSSWRCLRFPESTQTFTWPAVNPTVTASSGGTAIARTHMRGAYGRWGATGFDRNHLWVNNVSGTIGATDTITLSHGGGATLEAAMTRIPIFFSGKLQGGVQPVSYDSHYQIQIDTIMNLLDIQGQNIPTSCRTDWANALALQGGSESSVKNLVPEFRTRSTL